MTTSHHDVYSMPLDAIDVSDPKIYQDDVWQPYFERLRREAPVHYCRESRYGPYWSVCKYNDIMQVEINHGVYSSELGGIAVEDPPEGLERQSFIRMDPPKHDEQRKVVGPIVAPANLAEMEATIRERTIRVLDGLPRNETFDWVERVSIELTTMMLATLFDYPWEDRRQLTYWSDVAICNVHAPESPVHSEQEKFDELKKMAERMAELYNERAKQPPKFDLLSMLAHGPGNAKHAAARIYGQSDLVDRRRQRHDAQFDDRRPLRSEPASGRISEIAR
jgi:cytochrome P450